MISVSADGNTITVPYNEALDSQNLPEKSAFNVTVDNKKVEPTNIAVQGNNVVLTVPTIYKGQAVKVSYTDKDTDDTKTVQDIAGNDALTLLTKLLRPPMLRKFNQTCRYHQ